MQPESAKQEREEILAFVQKKYEESKDLNLWPTYEVLSQVVKWIERRNGVPKKKKRST